MGYDVEKLKRIFNQPRYKGKVTFAENVWILMPMEEVTMTAVGRSTMGIPKHGAGPII